jgi:hypothetical protein
MAVAALRASRAQAKNYIEAPGSAVRLATLYGLVRRKGWEVDHIFVPFIGRARVRRPGDSKKTMGLEAFAAEGHFEWTTSYASSVRTEHHTLGAHEEFDRFLTAVADYLARLGR